MNGIQLGTLVGSKILASIPGSYSGPCFCPKTKKLRYNKSPIDVMIEQLFAGIGLGLLTGLLVGLSSSPVVASVVGALAAGMITLLGFSRSSGETGKVHLATGTAWRLGS